MATVTLSFEIPFMDPNSENCAKLKELFFHCVEDMVTNNGHMLSAEQHALAKLLFEGPYAEPENAEELKALADTAGVR